MMLILAAMLHGLVGEFIDEGLGGEAESGWGLVGDAEGDGCRNA
jgi:hypothetical protein